MGGFPSLRPAPGADRPDTGGAISAADYALGVVDLIERDTHHRVQVNIGNPV